MSFVYNAIGHGRIAFEAAIGEDDVDFRRRAEALGTAMGALVAKTLRRREAYRYTSAREVWEDLRMLPAWQKRALFPTR